MSIKTEPFTEFQEKRFKVFDNRFPLNGLFTNPTSLPITYEVLGFIRLANRETYRHARAIETIALICVEREKLGFVYCWATGANVLSVPVWETRKSTKTGWLLLSCVKL
jgi:hypothetical protein